MKFTFEGDMHEMAAFLALLSPQQQTAFIKGIAADHDKRPQPSLVEKGEPTADRHVSEDANRVADTDTAEEKAENDAKAKRTRATKAEMEARRAAAQTTTEPPATKAAPAPEAQPAPAAAPANDESGEVVDFPKLKAALSALIDKKGAPHGQSILVNASGGKKRLGELTAEQYPVVHAAFVAALAA